MTDTTESNPEIATPASEAASAISSDAAPATATAEPTTSAMSASAETPSASTTAAANATPADAALNVAPESSATTARPTSSGLSSYFTRLRPDLGKYTPDFRKFMPSRQTAKLAGSLGFACAIGLIIGAGATFGAGHLLDSRAASVHPSSTPNETAALRRSVAKMEGQIAALKSSLDRASKTANAQNARLSERYDRTARAQTDLQTHLAKIGDTVDRLDKRMTTISTDITGSIAHQQHTAAATPVAVPTPTPAPVAVKKPEAPPIVEGWVLRDVFRGRALVESRRGVFEAAPGVPLPGLGQVESIRRQDGQWVVVTDKGLIVAARGARPHYRYDD